MQQMQHQPEVGRHRFTAGRLIGSMVVLALVGCALFVVHSRSLATQALACNRAKLHEWMDQDTTVAYRDVVSTGLGLVAAGHADGLIEEMMAYAATILAVEHQDEGMRALSHDLLARLAVNDGADSFGAADGYLPAARILASYGEGDLTEGLALAESVRTAETGLIMAKLEGLRLMVSAKLELPRITVVAQNLASSVTDQVRVLSYLAMWQLSQNNTAFAQQYLLRALAKSPGHPQALLGLQWVRLHEPHPAPQDLWQAQKTAGDVLRLPAQALSPPVRATALLVRAWALELEGDAPRAERDRAEAVGLDPAHLLHEVSREGPARP